MAVDCPQFDCLDEGLLFITKGRVLIGLPFEVVLLQLVAEVRPDTLSHLGDDVLEILALSLVQLSLPRWRKSTSIMGQRLFRGRGTALKIVHWRKVEAVANSAAFEL